MEEPQLAYLEAVQVQEIRVRHTCLGVVTEEQFCGHGGEETAHTPAAYTRAARTQVAWEEEQLNSGRGYVDFALGSPGLVLLPGRVS